MPKSIDIVNHRGQAPEPSVRDDDVLEAIHQVMHQYRAQQYRVLRDGPHKVTHMESKVLGFFGRHPGATQKIGRASCRERVSLNV